MSTSFGFGPVAKAVSVASVLKARPEARDAAARRPRLVFFGSGIALQFARRASCFDQVVEVDVDDQAQWQQVAVMLRSFDAVVSVLNFNPLEYWTPAHPPLVIVDSLAWLWSDLPSHIDRAAAYAIQDVFVPRSRIDAWASRCSLVLVGPVLSPVLRRLERTEGSSTLVVNFSGCANPILGDRFYESYVRTQTQFILEAARSRFESIVFAARSTLRAVIQPVASAAGMKVAVEHFRHEEFLKLLANARLVLTSPGLTATLECEALGTPVGFLLPQNYSQALMVERRLREGTSDRCLALSTFGRRYLVDPGLPEASGVECVGRHLQQILKERRRLLRSAIHRMVEIPVGVRSRASEPKPEGEVQVADLVSIAARRAADGFGGKHAGCHG